MNAVTVSPWIDGNRLGYIVNVNYPYSWGAIQEVQVMVKVKLLSTKFLFKVV